MGRQQQFIDHVCTYLDGRGFIARTLGVTDYDLDAPLKAIRRLMMESNGLITVAFRRTYIEKGTGNYRTDIDYIKPIPMEDKWITSPWSHIEPAMAFQIGLPVLILRESGVMADGILEKGVVGNYMPEFSADGGFDEYFNSPEWNDIIRKWEAYVRAVVEKKGSPPQLY